MSIDHDSSSRFNIELTNIFFGSSKGRIKLEFSPSANRGTSPPKTKVCCGTVAHGGYEVRGTWATWEDMGMGGVCVFLRVGWQGNQMNPKLCASVRKHVAKVAIRIDR